MKKIIFFLLLLIKISAFSQNKKPLAHDVYDGWKSIGERAISNNGKYVAYTIVPQEGDGKLILQNTSTKVKKEIDRGYGAVITNDNQFVIFKIKPKFADIRQAKIKKKKADEMPKDSLGIYFVGIDSVTKYASVKSYKTPEKGSGWVAYLADKPLAENDKKKNIDSLKLKIDGLVKISDSIIRKTLDSVKGNIAKEELIKATQKAVNEIYKNVDEVNYSDAEGNDKTDAKSTEGTDLIVKNTTAKTQKTFKLVSDYFFDKKGTKLVIKTTRLAKDSASKAYVVLYDLQTNSVDTIMHKFNDAKNFVFDDEGKQLAFVAERDSATKTLRKFYKLWYLKNPKDTAMLLVDFAKARSKSEKQVSEHAVLKFSKDGSKLFFGTAPILPVKDTNLVDFELARLDVWNYKDDYLQPQQLKNVQQELKRSYTAVFNFADNNSVQLGSDSTENIILVNEGNADYVLAQSDKGNRANAQWEGRTRNSAFIISTKDGVKKAVFRNINYRCNASPNGKYIYWYNEELKNYFTYNVSTGITKNITQKIKVPLYDTENDVPDYANAAGFTGWVEDDKYILVNDEYDIWKVNPDGNEEPINFTNSVGRKNKTTFSYVNFDADKRFIKNDENLFFKTFRKDNKEAGFALQHIEYDSKPDFQTGGNFSYPQVIKAKDNNANLFTKASTKSSELYFSNNLIEETKLTDIATQQKDYNWLTAELVKWKMFDGKPSEGILYKPENFDPKKKYPIIFYFYERNSDKLYDYKAPAPSASTINIPYFVSNGYLVFDPNIYYKTGEPGNSAYNSVVSAAKMFAKMPWVDSTRMAIQGQSWGGYQVAYLITKTNMFRAAGAGAPVANMTSAYGGIRWGTGLNRQFQYEKQQSRIGATLWERPDLYLKNSPLFSVDKIKTPLLMTHNDADDAVPWYQGIEMFTAMRRLGKPVWLLQYNDEAHNLVERKNRKDLSVRLAQFFDYYLKDAKPPEWMLNGVPATKKGIDWGLKIIE